MRRVNFTNQMINYNLFIKILKQYDFNKIKTIGGYFPINSEIGCLEILKKLERNNFKISLPITFKNSNMDFYKWSFKDPLKIGNQGIPEPFVTKKVYPDVLIIPLVGFDKDKFRLGYGGGFYDRYIAKVSNIKKVLKVGFAFSYQKIRKVPKNNFDEKLDYILTEKVIKK